MSSLSNMFDKPTASIEENIFGKILEKLLHFAVSTVLLV